MWHAAYDLITLKKNAWGMDIKQTDTQTHRHVDSLTDLAQRAQSVKTLKKTVIHAIINLKRSNHICIPPPTRRRNFPCWVVIVHFFWAVIPCNPNFQLKVANFDGEFLLHLLKWSLVFLINNWGTNQITSLQNWSKNVHSSFSFCDEPCMEARTVPHRLRILTLFILMVSWINW